MRCCIEATILAGVLRLCGQVARFRSTADTADTAVAHVADCDCRVCGVAQAEACGSLVDRGIAQAEACGSLVDCGGDRVIGRRLL